MISGLTSPSVCVIDDEKDDYVPILGALNNLYLGCIHILGSTDSLPPQQLKGLRVVFVDLHLSGTVGKNAASHTANVFRKVVSVETAPVLVVIWSKFADDPVDPQLLSEDQETEAELFKRTLLEAEEKYVGRLIFIEMKKPKQHDRNHENWFAAIGSQIKKTLEGKDAVHAIWTWESLVRDAALSVSEGLTSLARHPTAGPGKTLENLKVALRSLARAQGEGDRLSVEAAPRYLTNALAQLLADQLEHAGGLNALSVHGEWLSSSENVTDLDGFSSQMNKFLLTSDLAEQTIPYAPGNIYQVTSIKDFRKTFGKNISTLIDSCCEHKRPTQRWKEWRKGVRPILIELSPTCDVDQNHRSSALLVAGVIVPSSLRKMAKKSDASKMVPDMSAISLRRPMNNFAEKDVVLIFCGRYKTTLPVKTFPKWLSPWFRLRELPTASLRHWFASHASRVGYVSL